MKIKNKYKTFTFWFMLFMLFYNAVNSSHKTVYNWDLFINDILIFLNNPNRLFAFIPVIIHYFTEKEVMNNGVN